MYGAANRPLAYQLGSYFEYRQLSFDVFRFTNLSQIKSR